VEIPTIELGQPICTILYRITTASGVARGYKNILIFSKKKLLMSTKRLDKTGVFWYNVGVGMSKFQK